MTPEVRYTQATNKANILRRRNRRLFMEGKIEILFCIDGRKQIIEQIAAAYAEGLRDGKQDAGLSQEPPNVR